MIKGWNEIFFRKHTFETMAQDYKYENPNIHFGSIMSGELLDLLESQYGSSKKVILTDETVHDLWMEFLITSLPPLAKAEIIQIPAGEEFKTIEVCTQIWSALSDYEVGRKDLIINVGGGVVTDLGGFVASVFKRGLDFINIPTTVLSQVDASVGGKTGVDLGPFKNQLGLFADAKHVFIDASFLETLPSEQILSGFAEMIKHGLIADQNYWNILKSSDPYDLNALKEFIQTSIYIKGNIVDQDPKESGIRKTLNFGHSIGHGIEGFMLEAGEAVPHGYAVAWGMMAESFISLELELLDKSSYLEIKTIIQKLYPPAPLIPSTFKEVLKLMYNDKKNEAGSLQLSLLEGIGKCKINVEVTDKMVLGALKEITI